MKFLKNKGRMASKRPRTYGGGASSSSAKPKTEKKGSTHPLLDFSLDIHKERYAILFRLPMVANRCVDYDELAMVGLKRDVKRMVDGIEWGYFLGIWEPPVRKLLLKFLTTSQFHKMPRVDYDKDDVIVFRLSGIIHHMFVSEFGVKCGFYGEDILEIERYQTSVFEFHEETLLSAEVWRTISSLSHNAYKPQESKSIRIWDPALRYLHRFITYSLDGRGDSNGVVSRQDLFYLWYL